LPRGVGGNEAQVLELARAPWAAAFEVGDDAEDDEEAASCNTLERGLVLTVKIRQPSHEFTFGVGMSFIPYPLVITPVV
jgi:hypothetical protein